MSGKDARHDRSCDVFPAKKIVAAMAENIQVAIACGHDGDVQRAAPKVKYKPAFVSAVRSGSIRDCCSDRFLKQ
jgi:hypothetical protein